MQHVMGNEEPAPVELFRDLEGAQFARIRRNIEENWADVPQDSEEEAHHFWEWDENIVRTDLTAEEVAELADDLWNEAEQQAYEKGRREMSDTEWRADVDAAILDLMELAVG